MVEATQPNVVDMGGHEVMQCTDHPYKTNSPGGICAFCLQEKLGKLVSSSSSSFFLNNNNNSSSSSPTFRSNSSTTLRLTTTTTTTSNTVVSSLNNHTRIDDDYITRRARIPFLLSQKKKKKSTPLTDLVLKRSKSAATPRFDHRYLSSSSYSTTHDFSPRRRGFWSFLHLPNPKKPDRPKVGPGPSPGPNPNPNPTTSSSTITDYIATDEVGDSQSSPNSSNSNGGNSNAASFGRKVSRSRSVGCGSRSFSGDFFERISNGFGDCTLRRVESQREGRRSTSTARASTSDPIKERVRCGGIFGGFMITSSSSSSSSSSYWASVGDDHRPNNTNGPLVHGRTKSWGRAFASPMRAFSKPSTTTTITIKDGKKDGVGGGSASTRSAATTTTTPDLSAIPSLLAVRS